KGFDYGNIRITGLSGDLRDFYYSADSLSGNLRALRAKDGSGFEIRELRSRFSYTSSGAELEDLIARTEHSLLREHIKIAFPSLEALLANPSLMEIQATIRKSHLGVEDIYYFLPELDT